AALAKGLVPIALAIPFAWFLRRFWRAWGWGGAALAIVALPWYIAAYLKNGYPFLEMLFIRHHFERLYSPTLQHVQPWYYYVPVLLAGLFPWTPSMAVLFKGRIAWDQRRRFLATIFCFGFLLFSLTLNKLPGYLLPLFPSAFALIASECHAHFEDTVAPQRSRMWLLACAVLIACIPLIGSVLPESLALGKLSISNMRSIDKAALVYAAAPLAVIVLARRSWAAPLLVLCVVASGIYLKAACYPVLDRSDSARGLWREIEGISAELCDAGTNRDWIYGLNFYRGSAIPECRSSAAHFEIRSSGRGQPEVTGLQRSTGTSPAP
ncbi:MAG: hypothetical protein JOZ62_17115, partial [Acidobacteriaceae bacterium]|nr:hypothetical protein [Acidobacteriaceae bacterium]